MKVNIGVSARHVHVTKEDVNHNLGNMLVMSKLR